MLRLLGSAGIISRLMNYQILRRLLFLLPPELSHRLALQSLGLAQQFKLLPFLTKEKVYDPIKVMGIQFPNRVGLAAGLDKDAHYINALGALGFGFLEVGTVTPRPQWGNTKPRLFRLPARQAIINRMGFNNEGVDAMVKCIRQANFHGVLGINIGKNKMTPEAESLADYLVCLRKVYRFASYVVVNISSPNTQNLRSLQHGDKLVRLLVGLKEEHERLQKKYQRYVPLVIKIAPDLDDETMLTLAGRLIEFAIDGVIVSNTTISRRALTNERYREEDGGLSGAPLWDLSNHVLRLVAETVAGKLAVIGVGGIIDGDTALEKIRLGADLVQLYTGFIYQGPDLIATVAQRLSRYC